MAMNTVTLLNNVKSSTSSPTAYYTVTATPSNRTSTTVDVKITATGRLSSSGSSLTQGQSMGLDVNVKFYGNQTKTFRLKETSGDSWSGTTSHSKSATFTINAPATSTSITGITCWIYRTGTAAGGSSYGAQLNSTSCPNIPIDAGLTPSEITSVTSGTTDYAPVVTWTPFDASSVTFKIKYSYGEWSHTTDLITPNTAEEFSYSDYTIPGSEVAPYMANTSGTFTATLYTYESDGVTQVGDPTTAEFVVTLNDSFKPVATIGDLTDVGGIVPSEWGVYVQGKSKLSFPISATASTGSSISSYKVVVNGETISKNADSTITTGMLKTSGENTISLTVTDSRGRTASATKTFNVVEYTKPIIASFSAKKVNSESVEDESGIYVLASLIGEIASCEGNNNKYLYIGYKQNNATQWIQVQELNSAFLVPDLTINPNVQNTIYFKVEDSLGENATDFVVLDSAFKLMNFNKTLTSVAIGKKSSAADNEELFEVNMPTVIEKGFYSKPAGNVLTKDGAEALVVKRAASGQDGTPNNGIVLEYGPVEGYGGQFYMADNSHDGCYYGGWNGGDKLAWQKIILKNDLLSFIYPVGSIYMSVNNVNPGSFLGGTWVALQDRFLIGAGSSYAINAIGGSKDAIVPAHSHTGSVASSGAHSHTAKGRANSGSTSGAVPESYAKYGSTRNVRIPFSGTDGAHTHTVTVDSAGSDGTNANLPPYLAVYMWKRTA